MNIRRGLSFFILCLAITIVAGTSCSSFLPGERQQNPDETANLFNIPAQVIADDSIRSIQFHRSESPASAPILNLDNNDQLVLRFEDLSFEPRDFRVSISHHNPDWSRSGLVPERFLEGFYTIPITNTRMSTDRRPSYRQYSFTFPTEQFRITKSGNYLLKVEDADNGYLVFSLPFFVSENAGSLASSVEEISVPRQNLRRVHRPVSRYSLPDFVEQPQFDLEFYFSQNRFWGRTKKAGVLDFSAPDHVQFELSSNRAFTGDYEFRILTLDQLSQSDDNIVEAFPAEVPPRLILRDDAEGFSNLMQVNPARMGFLGNPDMSLDAGYANVVFRFDAESFPDTTASIHLLGDFNNWTVNSNSQLRYESEADRWQTNAIIKKGSYRYKYVLVENEKIDDLYFDDRFTDNRQQYYSFVYMRDVNEFYYRLLQVQTFLSE